LVDGSRYEGEFEDGLESGIGYVYNSKGDLDSINNWKNGKRKGQGIILED